MHAGNLLINLPPRQDAEREDILLAGASPRLTRILSWGQASPPGFWYGQDQDEWALRVAGRARQRFDDPEESRELAPGDHVLIPARHRHRGDWTDPARVCVWLARFLVPGQAQPPCSSS